MGKLAFLADSARAKGKDIAEGTALMLVNQDSGEVLERQIFKSTLKKPKRDDHIRIFQSVLWDVATKYKLGAVEWQVLAILMSATRFGNMVHLDKKTLAFLVGHTDTAPVRRSLNKLCKHDLIRRWVSQDTEKRFPDYYSVNPQFAQRGPRKWFKQDEPEKRANLLETVENLKKDRVLAPE